MLLVGLNGGTVVGSKAHVIASHGGTIAVPSNSSRRRTPDFELDRFLRSYFQEDIECARRTELSRVSESGLAWLAQFCVRYVGTLRADDEDAASPAPLGPLPCSKVGLRSHGALQHAARALHPFKHEAWGVYPSRRVMMSALSNGITGSGPHRKRARNGVQGTMEPGPSGTRERGSCLHT